MSNSGHADFTTSNPNSKGPTPDNPTPIGIVLEGLCRTDFVQKLVEPPLDIELAVLAGVDGDQNVVSLQISPSRFGIGAFAQIQVRPRSIGKIGNVELETGQIDDLAILKALDVIDGDGTTNIVASTDFGFQNGKDSCDWRLGW